MGKQKGIRKITWDGVLSWIVGILFIFASLGAFIHPAFIRGFIELIIGLVLLPPMNKFFKEKMNFELSNIAKLVVVIMGVILIGVLSRL